jgi:hypothetical protein
MTKWQMWTDHIVYQSQVIRPSFRQVKNWPFLHAHTRELGQQRNGPYLHLHPKGVPMICRRAVWVLGALALAPITPAEAHAQSPTQCLTNTPRGKQLYIPCDLLSARVNYPPGQRCVGPLDEYAPDVRAWCG